MTRIVFRPADEADAAAIAALHVKAWRATYGAYAPRAAFQALDPVLRQARWAKILGAPETPQEVLLAHRDERLVGMGMAAPPSQPLFGGRGEIRSLYLDPEVQGAGLGRRFMGLLAGRLADWGYPGAALGVVVENAPAIAFYQALGGRPAGRYVDPGPLWRSENLVMIWDDLSALTAAART